MTQHVQPGTTAKKMRQQAAKDRAEHVDVCQAMAIELAPTSLGIALSGDYYDPAPHGHELFNISTIPNGHESPVPTYERSHVGRSAVEFTWADRLFPDGNYEIF